MHAFENSTAFVTGGTGFIGSHLVERLLEMGFREVRCLVRQQLKWLEDKPIVRIAGDLFDEEALHAGCREVDFVFHVAGATGTRERMGSDAFLQTNAAATERLIDAARITAPRLKKLLATSSLAVIGACESTVADEDAPMQPVSHYGRSKAEMERILARYFEYIPIVIVRPSSVYGPRERDIFQFFRSFARGFAPVAGPPRRKELSFVHVRDLVDGLCLAAFSEATAGKTYFLGGPEIYSWQQIIDATGRAMNRNALTLRIPARLFPAAGRFLSWTGKLFGARLPLDAGKGREIAYACKACTHDRARADFGYKPGVSLDQGIAETIEWYRSEGWL